jgi:hypothetical protein
VVESRKNGQLIRGISWWDYLVGSTGFSRPPARPPVAARTRAPPRAIGSGHPAPHTAELHSPPARSVSLSQVNGQKIVQLNGIMSVLTFFSSFR